MAHNDQDEGFTMPRLETHEDLCNFVAKRFRDGDKRFDDQDKKIEAINVKSDVANKKLDQLIENTDGMVKFWKIGENTTQFGAIVGNFAVWLVKASIACGIVWGAFKLLVTGKFP